LSEQDTHGKGGTAVCLSKESLSYAYISSLLAKLSLNHNSPKIDDQSIDMTIYGRKFSGVWQEPQLELQLKCTNKEGCIDKKTGEIIIDLSEKNYDELNKYSPVPKVLIVHHAPDSQDEWVKENTNSIELMNMSYWYVLNGLPEISGGKRIRIPLIQKFDSSRILKMLEETSNLIPLQNLGLNNVQ
jgi:hypothetical protein